MLEVEVNFLPVAQYHSMQRYRDGMSNEEGDGHPALLADLAIACYLRTEVL